MNFTALCLLLFAAAGSYDQPFRPQFHFSPQQHWTNDPNGLIYFDGEYHLFFQYNPFGDQWGHMSWGHAVSKDLVHWQELPVALPEENGVMVFTGSTVADQRNTSGFCIGGKPCMVAVYTGHTPKTATKPALQTQNLAYSNDRGRTWTKYAQNPVLNLNASDFRDPDVFWSGAGKRWIMAVSLPDDHKIRFYGSPDLKKWSALSDFGPAGTTAGQWECPDLFELALDGNPNNKRWVLKVGLNPGGVQGGSGEQYFVGKFDGTKFVNENPDARSLWSDYGKDCYCALTFNNQPPAQKPVMIGWMNNWQYANQVPTTPWRGQMTVPRELALKTFPEGIRLTQQPLQALGMLASGSGLSRSFAMRGTVDMAQADEAGWKLMAKDGSYTVFGYDAKRHEAFVDRTHSGLTSFSKEFPARTAAPLPQQTKLTVKALVDRNSIEVFFADGRITITNLIFPESVPVSLDFYSKGAQPARRPVTEVRSIRSIW
ncbi:MAG: glycoside hydrolase family 32 protein [Acidobacteriota bacterium]|nr:glycoside hydrolase family 32 protein [Acidobacteriota bacterium]